MSRNDRRPVLLLDFDGTLTAGDGPVWAYLEAVLARSPLDPAGPAADGIRDAVRRYLSDGYRHDRPYVDGYHAVAALTEGLVEGDDRDAAYRHSRALLSEGKVDLDVAPEVLRFLDSVAGRCHRVLATNSPLPPNDATLERLGLAPVLDEIRDCAGKPARSAALVTSLLDTVPDGRPDLLMSVGDIWRNDLDAAYRQGCAVAYVDRHRVPVEFDGPRPAGASDPVTGPDFVSLLPALRRWLATTGDLDPRSLDPRQLQ